jgi:hypothetical protein
MNIRKTKMYRKNKNKTTRRLRKSKNYGRKNHRMRGGMNPNDLIDGNMYWLTFDTANGGSGSGWYKYREEWNETMKKHRLYSFKGTGDNLGHNQTLTAQHVIDMVTPGVTPV